MNSEHDFKADAHMKMRAADLMSDKDVLMEVLGKSADEAEEMVSRKKIQMLEEMKQQILLNNPDLLVEKQPAYLPQDEYQVTQMMALVPMAVDYKKNGLERKRLFYLDFYNEVVYDDHFVDAATFDKELNEHILKILREKKGMVPPIPIDLATKAMQTKNKIFEGMPSGKPAF